MKKRIIMGLAMLILSLGCRVENYSDGFRVGTIQKFSRKGIFWKTWEGELVQSGFRTKTSSKTDSNGRVATESSLTNIWEFSLDAWADPIHQQKMADQIAEAMANGYVVRLQYTEVAFCFCPSRSVTEYHITSVKKQE